MADAIGAAVVWAAEALFYGGEWVFTAGQITAIGQTATVLGSLAVGNAQQRRAKAKARAAYNASTKDREVTIRSAIAPRRIVYGRDKISGPLVFAQTTGTKDEFLHLVIALATHECDAIEEVWFNDTKLPDPDVDGWITSGPFGSDNIKRGTVTAVSTGGAITLPRAATVITDITRAATESEEGATYSGTHTPGSAVITGLPSDQTLSVGYEYATPARKVRIRKYLGAPAQVADADLVTASAGKWTSAHRGAGVCYLYVMLEYNQDIFGAVGVPNISAVVRGKKVLDPRTGATAWTQNAQLIAADWLRDSTFGLRALAAEMPTSEVTAGANLCDEPVVISAGGATQPRYTFNGSFTTDMSPRDVLEDILIGMAGTCVWTQGRWLLRPGAYRTPGSGDEITEDDLAGPGITITPRPSRSSLFNAVRVTYRDPDQAWAEVQAPLVTNATYVAQDGGVQVVRNISMPSAMDAIRAQRLAKIELERARQSVAVQFGTNMRAYNFAPTDTALLSLPRYGWGSGKVFELASRTWSHDGTLQYTGRETAPSVYAWNLGEATLVDPAPDTELPSPYTRPATMATLTVETGTSHLWRQADGTIVSRAYVQWPASSEQFVIEGGTVEVGWATGDRIDGFYSLPPLEGAATSAYIAPVPDGQVLVVRARFVNALGVRGGWNYRTAVVVGKTAPPANVGGFTAAVLKNRVRWSWSRNTEADFAYSEIRSANSDWGSTTVAPLWRGDATEWTESVAASGGLTRYIKHFDASGNPSAAAALASTSVSAADLVVGTADMALDAVTKVHTATAAGVAVTGEKGVPTGTFTDIASLTITPPVNCEVLIAVDGSVSIVTAASGSLGDNAMFSSRLTVNGAQVGPLRTYAIDLTIGFSKSASATISRALSFSATGGVTYTVTLQGQQYVVATTCTVESVRMRLEEIRR